MGSAPRSARWMLCGWWPKATCGRPISCPRPVAAYDMTQLAARSVDQMSLLHQVLFVFSKLYPGRHTLCPGCSEGSISLLTFFAAESLRNHPQGIATFYQGIKVLVGEKPQCHRAHARPRFQHLHHQRHRLQPGVRIGQSLQLAHLSVRPLRLWDRIGRSPGSQIQLRPGLRKRVRRWFDQGHRVCRRRCHL